MLFVVDHAVHEDGYAVTAEQQREERRQVRQPARAVVRRQDHRSQAALRHGKGCDLAVDRRHEAGEFLRRFALDAVREQDGAEFQRRHRPVEHRGAERPRGAAVERTRRMRPAADLAYPAGEVDVGRHGLHHAADALRIVISRSASVPGRSSYT